MREMTHRFTRRTLLLSAISAGLIRSVRPAGADDAATPTAPAGPVWKTLPPLPEARSEFAAAVIDRRIYVAGGFGAESRVDRYDPVSEKWTQLADLPVAIHHPGVAALDDLFYVAGGYTIDNQRAVDFLWVYDPARNSWTERASLPVARGAFGLVPFAGALYAVGGAREQLGGPVSGSVDRYDPSTDAWHPAASMRTPREHLAVVVAADRIFAIGGRANGDEDDRFAAANEAYDPVTDVWETRTPLPVPRGGLTGAPIAGRVIVMGGERGTNLYADVNGYDPASNTWAPLPRLPIARHGLASAALDDQLYAIGGSTLAQRVQNTPVVECLDLPANSERSDASANHPLDHSPPSFRGNRGISPFVTAVIRDSSNSSE
ncbi:MAG TPA: kelch repeat-containing protein [Thermomicrobiales bacterium]|nr:kelch repeat-containing protein [Thermomicrobiales bacterium]